MAASMKYIKTLMNLSVGPETKCVVQGFTGKSVSVVASLPSRLASESNADFEDYSQSTFHSKLSMDMGTNIVGGISPGKGGQTHLGKPVFDSVKEVSLDEGCRRLLFSDDVIAHKSKHMQKHRQSDMSNLTQLPSSYRHYWLLMLSSMQLSRRSH